MVLVKHTDEGGINAGGCILAQPPFSLVSDKVMPRGKLRGFRVQIRVNEVFGKLRPLERVGLR